MLHTVKKSMVSATLIMIAGIVFICQLQAAPVVPEPSNRTVRNFNLGWKFMLNTPDGSPQDSAYNDASWTSVSLPYPLIFPSSHLDGSTDCNSQPTFGRKLGWYRKNFTVQNVTGKKVFIVFQTVMQVATVYVNGKLVGTHERSGYDSFHFDITDFVNPSGNNVIAVKVDNNVNPNTPPDDKYSASCTNYPSGMDFILFGGMNGDVALVTTDPVHIGFQWESTTSGITITTPNPTTSSASVNIKVSVKNESSASKDVTVTTTIVDASDNVVGTPVTSTSQSIAANGAATFTLIPTVTNPKLWDTDNPNLYKVYTSVKSGSTPVDSLWTRFGIRSMSFSATTGFTLNGKSLKLIGTNRHSAWPFVGGAIPNTVHKREAQQIKDCGFNWIRLSHYPHDPEFLDAMDELGILGLEEAPTWAHGGGSTWMTNMYESLRREIRRDKNHPCIMTWNTNINHLMCEPTMKQIANTEDPSRTPGCYDGALPATVPTPMCFANIDDANAGPSIIKGGGLCIEHTGHTWRTPRFFTSSWSNEFRQLIQAKRHWEEAGISYATPSNSGIANWVMYDYNSFHNSGVDGGNGTGGSNDRNIVFHGVYDIYRIPKIVAFWYKSEFAKSPMVHIANFWMSNQPQHDTVTVFSNCDKVELFVNGVSKGNNSPDKGNTYRAALKHPPFFFSGITYAAGTLIAVGTTGGQVVARDTVRTPGTATKLMIENDPETLIADGADFGRVIVSVCDANGTVIPTASNAISLTATGAGSVISENPITADAGKIVFLVRAGTSAGNITINATSGSLTAAASSIKVMATGETEIKPPNASQKTSIQTLQPASRTFTFAGHTFTFNHDMLIAMNRVEVYDIQGKVVFRAPTQGLKTIDLSKSNKADGVFIVKAFR